MKKIGEMHKILMGLNSTGSSIIPIPKKEEGCAQRTFGESMLQTTACKLLQHEDMQT